MTAARHPLFSSRSPWNALATGGLAVMTGLWWINVELFISDWAAPPPSRTPSLFQKLGRVILEMFRMSSRRRSINAVCLANMLRPPLTDLILHSGISSALYLLLANYFLGLHSHSNWSCAAASLPSAAPSASLSTFFFLPSPLSSLFPCFLSSSKSHPINMLMSW